LCSVNRAYLENLLPQPNLEFPLEFEISKSIVLTDF